MSQFIEREQSFHFSIYRAAHSEVLYAMIGMLWLQIGPLLGVLMDTEAGQDPTSIGFLAHDRLMDALAAGDSDGARSAINKDIRDTAALCRPLVKA